MSVSITELIWQVKTWEKSIQEVGFFYVCSFLLNAITVSIDLGLKLHFLWLPLMSTVFRLFLFWREWESKTTQWVDPTVSQRFFMRATERVRFSFTFYIDDVIVRLKYYCLLWLKTTRSLIIYIVWHVSTNFTDTIWNIYCVTGSLVSANNQRSS